MTTLFVNACMRGEQSRTLELCREYLEGKEKVVEVNLAEMGLKPFDAGMVAYRAQLQKAGVFDDPIFDLSQQFAEGGRDRDRRAVLGPFVPRRAQGVHRARERVRHRLPLHRGRPVRGSSARATRLTYLTTCGGFVEGANFGYEYLCGIAKMFGIPEVRFVAAEGLDIVGIDVDVQMDKARAQMAKLD